MVTVIVHLCHRELREHLVLSTEDVGCKHIREEIFKCAERKRDTVNLGVKATEVDHVDENLDATSRASTRVTTRERRARDSTEFVIGAERGAARRIGTCKA